MTDGAGDDRRRQPRLETSIDVDYGSERTFLFAKVTDVSTLGIFINTDTPEAVGTQLSLHFRPPAAIYDPLGRNDEPLELVGEVVWNTGERPDATTPGMGIRFIELSRAQRDLLTGLVRAIAYLHDQTAS